MNDQRQDRERAADWARQMLADPTVVILDTETTGLGPDAEIVQIAVIDAAGITLLDTLVRPTRSIPPDATRVHGITDAMVAEAPTFAELAPLLYSLIGGRRVVIYNASYDMRLLRQTAVATKAGKWPGLTADCAMNAYSEWVGDWSEYHGNYRWQRLPGGDHSALGDARATLAVLRVMAATWPDVGVDAAQEAAHDD